MFVKSKLWRMDLLYNLDAHLELIINHPTGTQVFNYVISKEQSVDKEYHLGAISNTVILTW